MAWRVAYALDKLLQQLNSLAPNRSRASDGSIGDAAHQAEGSASDHNPWYGPGIVTARDFTHDPTNGLDCDRLAAALIASRDPRIKYLIWRGRIVDSRPQFSPWTWQPSSGHYQHLHLSVMANASADDTRPWSLPGLTNEEDEMTEATVRNGLAGWLKNDLAPGTDQRALLQQLLAETEIEVRPDEGKPWMDRIGNVIGAIDRRLVRVEQKAPAPAPVQLTDADRAAIVADVRQGLAVEVADLIAARLKD